MFVIEDPSRKKGVGYKELQKSRVNAHASIVSHERRRRQRERPRRESERLEGIDISLQRYAPAPQALWIHRRNEIRSRVITFKLNSSVVTRPQSSDFCLIDSTSSRMSNDVPRPLAYGSINSTNMDCRSFQYFQERTAIECSGWHDVQFWTEHVLQVASLHLGVRYALESLGACHEMGECSDLDRKRALRSFANSRGRNAFDYLVRFYEDMSISSVFTISLVVCTIMLLIDEQKMQSMLRYQYDLIARYRKAYYAYPRADCSFIDGHIEPVMLRQMGITSSFMDYTFNLRHASLADFDGRTTPKMPNAFISIRRAREVLEDTLNFTTYQVKSSLWSAQDILNIEDQFLQALGNYAPVLGIISEQDQCNLFLIEIFAQFGFIVIQTLLKDEEDELFFDAYAALYVRFAECLRRVFRYRKRTSQKNITTISFGTDGILVMAGQVILRWCRDPKIRRELIQLVRESPRREANADSMSLITGCEAVMQIEERGLVGPKTCHDIPEQNRIRLNVSRFLLGGLHHIQYSMYPWGKNDIGNLYLQDPSNATFFSNVKDLKDDIAFLTIGKGFCSFLDPQSPSGYSTYRNLKFFFPIPAV